jgi:asparagine synthase (glutamine-hydrolysing)
MALIDWVGVLQSAGEPPHFSTDGRVRGRLPIQALRRAPLYLEWTELAGVAEGGVFAERDGVLALLDGWVRHTPPAAVEKLSVPELRGPTVVLDAYERWGADFPKHVDGEFALVLWDARQNQLHLCRDTAGARPLCWSRLADGSLIFGSTPKSLFSDGRVSRRLSLPALSAFLASRIRRNDLTVFDTVKRVPRATHVRFHERDERVERYFRPTWAAFERDEDNVEAFRDALFDSVRARLPMGPCATLLSGGLDSSSVTCVGASLEAKQLLAISGDTQDEPGRRDMLAAQRVVERWKLTWEKVPIDGSVDIWSWLAHTDEIHVLAWLLLADPCTRRAKERGFDTLMTGALGDTVGGGAFRLNERLLAEGAWRQLYRRYSRLPPWPRTKQLIRLGAARWLPGLLNRWEHLTTAGQRESQLRGFLSPELERHLEAGSIRDTMPYVHAPQWFATEVDRRCDHADMGELTVCSEVGRRFRVELIHPLAAMRIVEIGAAVPWSLRSQGGMSRVLIRRAVGDLLPREVAERRDKSRFIAPYADFFRKLIPDLSAQISPQMWEIVDRNRFQHACHSLDHLSRESVQAVFRLAVLGSWMNHFTPGCTL